jgi:uncharacterized protein (PEP-CTERM system associated)
MATTTPSGGRIRRVFALGRPGAAFALLAVVAAVRAQQAAPPLAMPGQPAASPGTAASGTPPAAAGQATAPVAAPAAAGTRPPPFLEPALSVSLVGSDNAALAPDDTKRSDAIGQVTLDLRMRHRSPRLTILGDVGADFIGYARESASDHVLPRGNLDLAATLVERALFLDAGVAATRTRADALLPFSGEASTANTVSSVTWRASPYFEHDFTPTVSALVRSDTLFTRNESSDPDVPPPMGSTVQREIVRVERKPVPVGLALEASREETTYEEQTVTPLMIESARATVSVGVDQELLFGAVGGRDHAEYGGTTTDETLYGGLMQWRPSTRTALDVEVEHRFFGTGFDVRFRDRLPMSVIDLSLQRAATATPSAIGLPQATTDPAALLDSLLSTRVPDANARDNAVDEIATSRSLPTSFAQPVDIFTQTPQLATTGRLDLLLNGARNSVLGSLFYLKATVLPGTLVAPVGPNSFDSRQWGGSLGWYHRLSPQAAAAAEITYADVQALGDRSGDSSRQWIATLSLSQRVAPQATFSYGLRRLSARVTLASVGTAYDVDENQVFAGLRMQY